MQPSKGAYPHRQQQLDWFDAWRNGDMEAGAQLLASCDRLIEKIARTFYAKASEKQRTRCDLEDLIQLGRLKLWERMGEFDPRRKTLFGTFARFKVTGAISEFLLAQRPNIPKGRLHRKLYYRLGSTMDTLERQGIVPTEEMIARYLGFDAKKGAYAVRTFHDGVMFTMDDEERPLYLVSVDTPFTIVTSRTRSERVQFHLEQFLETLDERERTIIWAYTVPHLIGEKHQSLKDIGESLGISHEMVRKLSNRISKKFREYCSEVGLHEFLVP